MTIQEKKKYGAIVKLAWDGSYLISRTWLVKQSAIDFIMETLADSAFESGSLLTFDLNDGRLLAVEDLA